MKGALLGFGLALIALAFILIAVLVGRAIGGVVGAWTAGLIAVLLIGLSLPSRDR